MIFILRSLELIDHGCPTFIVCILNQNLSPDGIRAFPAFLLFQMVLNRVVSFPPPFQCVHGWLKCKSQQIGCLYSGTLINHLMHADDLCIFLPVLLIWKNLQIAVPLMVNCLILLIMPISPIVWLLTANPRTWKIFFVSTLIIIHYLILENVNILVI